MRGQLFAALGVFSPAVARRTMPKRLRMRSAEALERLADRSLLHRERPPLLDARDDPGVRVERLEAEGGAEELRAAIRSGLRRLRKMPPLRCGIGARPKSRDWLDRSQRPTTRTSVGARVVRGMDPELALRIPSACSSSVLSRCNSGGARGLERAISGSPDAEAHCVRGAAFGAFLALGRVTRSVARPSARRASRSIDPSATLKELAGPRTCSARPQSSSASAIARSSTRRNHCGWRGSSGTSAD